MRLLAIVHQRDAGPGVFAEAAGAAGAELDRWHVAETPHPPAEAASYDAVLVLGGAMNVDQVDRHPWLRAERELLAELLARDVPLLGVCLGAQLLSEAAGGDARRAREPEIGWFEVEVTGARAGDPVVGPLAPRFEAFEWHSYECGVPEDAEVLATTPICAQAFRVGARAWGIQFHAEVSRADAGHWIDDYGSDPDAVRIGVDPVALRRLTEERIDAHNELGRELCARFIAGARERRGTPARATTRRFRSRG
ncbi:MAG: type 1 glutamine amidotransferase [Solirubrobacterales bacterium]|nr:type 1 glutamine amidotransferase [Solirubrobacterales bacterium]